MKNKQKQAYFMKQKNAKLSKYMQIRNKKNKAKAERIIKDFVRIVGGFNQ